MGILTNFKNLRIFVIMEKLFIKNMVCNRCVLVVQQELEKLNIEFDTVQLGEVNLKEPLNDKKKTAFSEKMLQLGFELIDDQRSLLIEKIKAKIIALVHYTTEPTKENMSVILAEELGHDYSYLSKLFSEVEGTTIEKFLIAQKIEKVKELLMYDELTLNEIAYQLNYSSVAYLSNQFKKITGLTPSHFKKVKENRRKSLDEV